MNNILLKGKIKQLGTKFNCTEELLKWVTIFVSKPELETIETSEFLNLITKHYSFKLSDIDSENYVLQAFLQYYIQDFEDSTLFSSYIEQIITYYAPEPDSEIQISNVLNYLYRRLLTFLLEDRLSSETKEKIFIYYCNKVDYPKDDDYSDEKTDRLLYLSNIGVYPLSISGKREDNNLPHLTIDDKIAQLDLKTHTPSEYARAYLTASLLTDTYILADTIKITNKSEHVYSNIVETEYLLDKINNPNPNLKDYLDEFVINNIDYLNNLYYVILTERMVTEYTEEFQYSFDIYRLWLKSLNDKSILLDFYKKFNVYLLLPTNNLHEALKTEYVSIYDLFKNSKLDFFTILKISAKIMIHSKSMYVSEEISEILKDFNLTNCSKLLSSITSETYYVKLYNSLYDIILASLSVHLDFLDALGLERKHFREIINEYKLLTLRERGIELPEGLEYTEIELTDKLSENGLSPKIRKLLQYVTSPNLHTKLLIDTILKLT